MENCITPSRQKQSYHITIAFIVTVLLMVFCVTKVLRGTDNERTTQGGIWNYISLIYYPLFLLCLYRYRSFRVTTIFSVSAIYCIVTALISLLGKTKSMSIELLYQIIMLPYPFLVLGVFYFSFRSVERENHAEKLILVTYYICLILNLATISRYQLFGGQRPMASDIYYSLCLFPFALVLKQKRQSRILVTILQFFACFLSNKRAGFLGMLCGVVVYYMISLSYSGRKNVIRAAIRLLLLAASVFLVYRFSVYFDNRFKLNIYSRLYRVFEDEGSGRTNLYQTIIRSYRQSEPLAKLFGHGIGSIRVISSTTRAHNDFLETLYSYGFFSFACFLSFHVGMVVKAIKMLKKKSPYSAVFMMSIVISAFLSSFSFFLTYFTYVTGMTAFWGYLLAKEENRRISLSERGT